MNKKLNSSYSIIYNCSEFPQKKYDFIVDISTETLLFFLGVMVSISIEQFTDISCYVIDVSKVSSIICFDLKILQLICSIIINYCVYKIYRFSSELHGYTLKTKLEEERDNKIFAKLLLMADFTDPSNTSEMAKKMSDKINEVIALVIGLVIFGLIMFLAYIANGMVINLL